LSRLLFSALHVPLVRASFDRRDGDWHMRGLRILSAGEISDADRALVAECAMEYMGSNAHRARKSSPK